MAGLGLTEKQNQVVDTRGKTMLVSASAGSGKTFVVIERIIKRIIEDKVDIDRILVVTFTNAAASELKERLVKKLQEKLKETADDKELEMYIKKQLRLVNKANISTIHSFCLSVISSSFYYLEIEPSVKTIEQAKSSVMMSDILYKILENEYIKKEQVFIDCLDLFGSEANLISTIFDLYYFAKNIEDYEDWLNNKKSMYELKYADGMDLTETQLGKDIFKDVKTSLRLVKARLENILSKIVGDPDLVKRVNIIETLLEKVDRAIMLGKYNDIYSYIPELLDNKTFAGLRGGTQELRDESSSVMKEAIKELKSINRKMYKDTKGIIEDLNSMLLVIEFLIRVVKQLDKEYMNEKTKLGYIDFNDYEHLALKALSNQQIKKEYLDKFAEIYVDEYQDTSSIQEKVISQISKSNNVVMVGDLKQSIYSFRNADPSLLGNKYEIYDDISGDENDFKEKGKIVLSKNFRSRKEVLHSTNYIFARIMSKEYGGLEYSDKESLIYSGVYDDKNMENIESIYKTEINIIDTKEYLEEDSNNDKNQISIDEGDTDSEEIDNSDSTLEDTALSKQEKTKMELEAAAVGNRINEFIDNKFQIYDLKTKKYRNAEYRDIVILMRAPSSKVQVISEVLESMNIPIFSDSSEGFYDSEEIDLIISFLKVLNNHLDDISLASIMYSIIGKFTLDDMVAIKRYDKNGSLYSSLVKCKKEIGNIVLKNKISNFLENIYKFIDFVRIYSVSETIEKLYIETGIYYSFYLEEYSENKCMKLNTLVELAKNFEREEKAILSNFIQYIENIKRIGDKGENSPKLIGENEDVVRLMTIHKSKGLEFPIVILCDSNKEHDMRESKSIFVLNKEVGIGINIYDKEFGISYPSVIKQNIKEKMKQNVISEELRLLYVAMTRAKEKLCIFGSVKDIESVMQKMNTEEVEGKINKDFVKGASSYLKAILMSISKGYINNEQDFLDNFEVNIVKPNKVDDKKEDLEGLENYDNVIHTNSKHSKGIDRSISLKDKFVDIADKIYKGNLDIDVENLKQYICKEYRYIESSKTKRKYTVTELKKSGNKNDNIVDNILDEVDSYSDNESFEGNLSSKTNIMPKVLLKTIDAMSYGTIIHNIIERVDLINKDISKDDIKDISKLVVSKYENFGEHNLNRVVDMIYSFLNSEIRTYLDNAKEIKKELEYLSLENLSDIEELKLSENTIIQGIVDLYIETKDGKRIIIDFKTDRVKQEQELIDRYKYQLMIYKSGLENVMNIKIDMLFIYSFELKKLIKLA